MKRLECEMCGSTDLVKQNGMFECRFCGCKYSVEEAKKMMIEGTVDVSGSTVKVDASDEIANLYQIARRAKNAGDNKDAAKYYEMILIKDPNSWEASFYVVYFKAMECTIAQIQSAGTSVVNCLNTVFKLIKDNVDNKEEQKEAYSEVATQVMIVSSMLFNAAKNHYNGIDTKIRANYKQEWVDNAIAAINCTYVLGYNLDSTFGKDIEANKLSVAAWSQGISWHQFLIAYLADKDEHRKIVNIYTAEINKYDASYTAPDENRAGCYVATAVYGSYDCPQVWTLRRYRDYTLATTWYGRAFIHIYYAVSPTLVKWFGYTGWFKKIGKSKLDILVAKLQANGIESAPYEDKNW